MCSSSSCTSEGSVYLKDYLSSYLYIIYNLHDNVTVFLELVFKDFNALVNKVLLLFLWCHSSSLCAAL